MSMRGKTTKRWWTRTAQTRSSTIVLTIHPTTLIRRTLTLKTSTWSSCPLMTRRKITRGSIPMGLLATL